MDWTDPCRIQPLPNTQVLWRAYPLLSGKNWERRSDQAQRTHRGQLGPCSWSSSNLFGVGTCSSDAWGWTSQAASSGANTCSASWYQAAGCSTGEKHSPFFWVPCFLVTFSTQFTYSIPRESGQSECPCRLPTHPSTQTHTHHFFRCFFTTTRPRRPFDIPSMMAGSIMFIARNHT